MLFPAEEHKVQQQEAQAKSSSSGTRALLLEEQSAGRTGGTCAVLRFTEDLEKGKLFPVPFSGWLGGEDTESQKTQRSFAVIFFKDSLKWFLLQIPHTFNLLLLRFYFSIDFFFITTGHRKYLVKYINTVFCKGIKRWEEGRESTKNDDGLCIYTNSPPWM